MLRRSPAQSGHRTITFVLPAEWSGRVSVVGNFNDWTPGRLTLRAAGDAAEASVVLPADYIAVFRYLGDGGHWFDEPDADFVDAGASVVLAAVAEPDIQPEPEPSRLLTPAQKATNVGRKRREREANEARKAAEKAARKREKLADKITKAEQKQPKAAERVAKERDRMATRQARKAAEQA